mmetsp:Transcript_107363/g.256473  ORF Transcript_107363/g.256473 Transcript_107363/m.256473 type:complete len:205 (-) Transcript_107363:420-1034(-)
MWPTYCPAAAAKLEEGQGAVPLHVHRYAPSAPGSARPSEAGLQEAAEVLDGVLLRWLGHRQLHGAFLLRWLLLDFLWQRLLEPLVRPMVQKLELLQSHRSDAVEVQSIEKAPLRDSEPARSGDGLLLHPVRELGKVHASLPGSRHILPRLPSPALVDLEKACRKLIQTAGQLSVHVSKPAGFLSAGQLLPKGENVAGEAHFPHG